jgi:hypothetical protein
MDNKSKKAFDALIKDKRATEKEQKKEILNRFYKLWIKFPHLRFGQVIGNVIRQENQLYYIEDYPLIEKLEQEYQALEVKYEPTRKYKK